jgi:hypothetical protein
MKEGAQWLSGISVDCVIFGFHENQLKVLLLKFKKTPVWALAGGFVGVEEDVDQAAQRILRSGRAYPISIWNSFTRLGIWHEITVQ